MQICLLGAGSVATHLGLGLVQAGHRVQHVWSRTPASAAALARQLPGATASTALDLRHLTADVFLLSVPDAGVEPLLAGLQLPVGALVAHTAGALPLAVFAPYPTLRGGVFYPLQTFSIDRQLEWATVPLFIEASNPTDEVALLALAHSLSREVRLVATPQRLALHVAAVFASNFPYHLLGLSHTLLQEAALPFELLAPLVRETMEKALAQAPFVGQTGPAARHDAPTLARHEAALQNHPEWQQLYKSLSDSIQRQPAPVPVPE